MEMEHKELSIDGYRVYLGGVSEIGLEKRINQDAFRIGGNESVGLAYSIVADGLGSCVNSDKGARCIVEIVEKWLLEKLSQYTFLSDNVANILRKRILEAWQESFSAEEIATYDTTVHMAVFYKGGLLIGGIGDGMALLSYDNLVCKDQVDHKNMFSNVTNSICSLDAKELFDFNVVSETEWSNQAAMILSTDGISDDLIPEMKLTLPDYFRGVICEQGMEAMQAELKDWIENWETEYHSDDKTICYLVVEKEAV